MAPGDQRYARELIIAIGVYAVVLAGSVLLIRAYPAAWWRYPLAVTPIVPVLFAVRAVVRRMRTLDELQQRIQLEALAFAFGVSAVLTFTYGFLEGVGFPHLNWTWVFPIMVWLWGIGQFVAGRRYK